MKLFKNLVPRRLGRVRDLLYVRRRGVLRHRDWRAWNQQGEPCGAVADGNPLERFFEERKTGPGIWKWRHYFEIYHRHLAKFVGREPRVMEIGVYSGGSLSMWRSYFGRGCSIYGVDIEPACRAYEEEGVKILIGDQADRSFWRRVRGEVAGLDVVIDDGGHRPEQQIVTLEETLPYLRPGGVYICEDVTGSGNAFLYYVEGLAANLHADRIDGSAEDDERRQVSPTTAFQAAVKSVHFYPYVVVIERTDGVVKELVAPKHGTQWQPHLK